MLVAEPDCGVLFTSDCGRVAAPDAAPAPVSGGTVELLGGFAGVVAAPGWDPVVVLLEVPVVEVAAPGCELVEFGVMVLFGLLLTSLFGIVLGGFEGVAVWLDGFAVWLWLVVLLDVPCGLVVVWSGVAVGVVEPVVLCVLGVAAVLLCGVAVVL